MRKILPISLILILYTVPVLALAATATFIEPGADAGDNFGLYNSTVAGGTGSISSDNTQFHTGPDSIKIAAGASTGGGNVVMPLATLSDTGSRIDFWFRTNALVGGTQIFQIGNSSAQSVLSLRMDGTTPGILDINNGQGTTLAAGTIAITTNSWNRITVSYTITNTTVNTIKLYINGTLSATATNVTLVRTGSDHAQLQLNTNAAAGTINWFDDIYIDNGTDLADPGDIRVTVKRPIANGALNQWTTQIGSGGSGYGTGHAPQVNERPLSSTNGWSIQNASTQTEEYSIEGPSVGDVDLTNHPIYDYEGWVYEKVGSNSTGNIIVNGVATNNSVTTSYSFFTQFARSTTYPSGSNAIGVDTNGVNQLFSLAEAGVLIAFNPTATNPPTVQTLHRIVFTNLFKFLFSPSSNSKFKFIFN